MSDAPHAPRDRSTADRLPAEIGGYEIQRVLGSGGMATVYAALQKQPRRTVALKVMRGAANARNALHRFKREIEILGRLRHPYIAQVYDAGVHEEGGGPVPFFVMEYVPGAKTIVEYAAAKELSIREILRLFVKVCAAVENGHQNKIIHRDLKPGNILIDEKGDPKIIDFGVARAVEVDVVSQTMHTEEGRLVGTIKYMAPEQLDTQQRDLNPRCDVYALGVVLYRLLTGRSPYELQGLPVFTAVQVVREDLPPRPSSVREELKGDLETIILKAMAKDPNRRYRSAGSLGRDIVRFLADKPIHARKAGIVHRARLFARRHKVELRAGAIVAMVMIVAGAIVLYQRSALRRGGDDAASTVQAGGTTPAGEVVTSATTDDGAAAEPETFLLSSGGSDIAALGFSRDGAFLAVAHTNRQVNVHDLATREVVLRTADHDHPIQDIALVADSAWLVTVSEDGKVVIVERDDGRFVRLMRDLCDTLLDAAVSEDGGMIAVACDDLLVRVHEGAELRHTLRGSHGMFQALAFSPDRRRLVGGSRGGAIYIWDIETGDRLHRIVDAGAPITTVGFAASGERVVALDERGEVRVWDLDEQPPRRRAFDPGLEGSVDVSIDREGHRLICVGWREIAVFDLASLERVGEPMDVIESDPRTPGMVATSPEGRLIAVGRADGRVRVVAGPTAGATLLD